MCEYCDGNSNDCRIWFDELEKLYYLDIETSEWNDYDDNYFHQREYIGYCPFCGRKLSK